MPELLAICDRCRREIADGEGAVSISRREVRRARVYRWRLMEALLNCGLLSLDDEEAWWEFIRTRPQARWRVLHDACGRHGDYSFGVDRIRTRADFIEWGAHLVTKDWFVDTDWVLLGAEAVAGRGTRLSFSPALVVMPTM